MGELQAARHTDLTPELMAKNSLTGLYSPRGFIEEARLFIPRTGPNEYCLIAMDIMHFRLFNKFHGRSAGDQLLIQIAGCLEQIRNQYGGVTGYFEGDNFCVVMPWRADLVEELWGRIGKAITQMGGATGVIPLFGISLIDDIELPPEVYYDRATLALSRATARDHTVPYDPGMESFLEEEIRLLMEVTEALEHEEFTFFAQPQCDIFTGKVVGAESLVRWQHKTRGMIPPARFVPVLERSGMIYLLDKQVWEKVCQWLRSWLDRGNQPVPISINISRIDIMSMDVPAYLTGLLEKYDLPAKYIKAEITESAYAEEDDNIDSTVSRLRQAGFLVMMDDFGSGYSSLNMLKSVAVDVIKIDMRFLEINEEEEQKGIGILESIVNMARLMGLPIIVEGVETLQQENVLRSMGCRYTQGYYYYKPLPIEQFEAALADKRRLDLSGLHCKQVEAFHVRELMDGNLFTDTAVNNILGPCAIYEICGNQVEITRVNEQAYRLAGLEVPDNKDLSKKIWSNVRDDDRAELMSLFEWAYERRPEVAEGSIHYLRVDGRVLWVLVRVFFLREKEGRRIYFVSLTDMTALRNLREEKVRAKQPVTDLSQEDRDQLDQFYGVLPCGLGVAKILLNEEQKADDYDIIYVNREMERMCGKDIGRIRHLILRAFGDDFSRVLQKAYQAAFLGERLVHYAYSALSNHYLQLTLYQYEYGYAGCLLQDITQRQLHEEAFRSMVLSYQEVYYLNLQENYCRMLYPDGTLLTERGNYEAMIERHFGTGRILKYGEAATRQFLSLGNLRTALMSQDTVEHRYRRCTKGNPDEWCLTTITINERERGRPKTAVVTVRSIDKIIKEDEERRQGYMARTLANMSDAFFIYRAMKDEDILYANPAVMELYGCESMMEFMDLVGHSFRGMVHPEDLNRVEWEIEEQIRESDENMDYVQYRIIRRDGEVRWVEDYGHLETSKWGEEHRLFYVFLKDITDIITQPQQQKLLDANRFYADRDPFVYDGPQD